MAANCDTFLYWILKLFTSYLETPFLDERCPKKCKGNDTS